MATLGIKNSLPPSLQAALEKSAIEQSRSFDEVLAEAVERYLRLKRREKLRAYGESQAEKLGLRERDVPKYVSQTRQSDRRR
ncbi:MAG: hypothetical protein WAM39_01995 [Bryobacteraceae bacterium]